MNIDIEENMEEQLYQIVIENGILKQFDKAYDGDYAIPSCVRVIQHHAFIECEFLTGITIPASVESIGELAFSGCIRLNRISVAKDNPVFDSLENCHAIIETASNTLLVGCENTRIPDSVTRIGENAFDGAYFMEEIIIPESVKVIDNWAFASCCNLKYLHLPESL